MSFTDIFAAAQEGTVDDVKSFLDKGVDVNAKDKYGQTPLHIAVGRENIEIVKFLVSEKGADVNAKEVDEKTPLHLAATYNNNVEVAKFLIENGADVKAKNIGGYTPLHSAVGGKNVELVRCLVTEGKADVEAKDKNGGTPLHTAVRNGQSAEIIKFLVSKEGANANVNAKDNDDTTPLHSVAMKQNIEFAKILISSGKADVNAKDKRGLTPLGFALHFNNTELINIFNNAGTNENAKDQPSDKANIFEDTPSSTETKNPLIITVVGAVIGGIIGGSIAGGQFGHTEKEILVGILIGAFFGMGLGPFLEYLKEFLGSGDFGWWVKTSTERERTFEDKLKGLFFGLLFWAIIGFFKLGLALIASPFIAIYLCLTKGSASKKGLFIAIFIALGAIVIALILYSSPTQTKNSKPNNNSMSEIDISDSRDSKAAEAKAAAKASVKSFTDSRDGKAYKTVTIGKQTWMAENLNYNTKGGKCHGDNPENCKKYGRLYNWFAAIKACSGWHLPSNSEWDILYRSVDGTSGTESPYKSETAGKYLKAKSGWNEGGNGTDNYGFAALPGGLGNSNGSFFSLGNYGNWWSSTESDGSKSYNHSKSCKHNNAGWESETKSKSFSVRCVRD